MKTYKVPVEYTVKGYLEIEAANKTDAIDAAYDMDLPDDVEAVEDTVKVIKNEVELIDETTDEDDDIESDFEE